MAIFDAIHPMSIPSHSPLTLRTTAFLTLAPLLWAGNAVVGRAVAGMVPPVTLNFLRWVLAALILLPFAWRALRLDSPLWPHWRRYAVLGLLGIGCYNMLQYMALQTSSPVNVTLVGASMPLWMMLVGRLFYAVPVTRLRLLGAVLSLAGVLLVLSRGSLSSLLNLQLVAGDLYMLAATICWSLYSWMLPGTTEPASVRGHWQSFLLAQIAFGLLWSGGFAALEWSLQPALHVQWGWQVLAALAYVATGPAVLAYGFWGRGVQQAGPTVAGFFVNLVPVFAAVLATVLLDEAPAWYHGLAFVLIVAGIVVSSRPARSG